jgi:hypothetical protein
MSQADFPVPDLHTVFHEWRRFARGGLMDSRTFSTRRIEIAEMRPSGLPPSHRLPLVIYLKRRGCCLPQIALGFTIPSAPFADFPMAFCSYTRYLGS